MDRNAFWGQGKESVPVDTSPGTAYSRSMTELIATLVAIVGTGLGLAALILPGQAALRRDIGDLRERMAKLERLLEGLTTPSSIRRPRQANPSQ